MKKDRINGLFCFDGPLYKDANGVYCNVTLTDEMFNRYFSVVDFLYIVVRTFNSDKTYLELNMKPLTLKNIKVIEVKNFNTIKGFIFDKREFEKSLKSILDKVDMIFARMPSNTSNSVLKIASKMKKPFLIENGGCAWDSFWNHSLFGKIVAPLMYYREKKYVKKADYAVYVTKYFLQKRYPNKNVTTNCSNVYLSKTVDSKTLDNRINKIKKMNLKKIVIGQAVNSVDVRYKGEQFILRAMKKLNELGIIVEYQIAGPGNGDFLRKTAKKYGVFNQLKFIGALKKEEMIEWYKSIDIYVQPSKQEGLPRAVIEAMSTGCPCLGSNIAGIPELLEKECMFNPNKNNEIVNAIKNILNINKLIFYAKLNFNKSKEYNIDIIESRRKEIFLEYKKKVLDVR